MNEAIEEFLKSHTISNGWEPIGGTIQDNGLPVVLLYNGSNEEKYSVQYAGSGKYFDTKESALRYIVYRGWKWNFTNKNQYYKLRSQIKNAIKGLQEGKRL